MLKINYVQKDIPKNCWTIKFSLDDGIYLIPFSHSTLAVINKDTTTEEEFLELLNYIFYIIGKYAEDEPCNIDTLPDLEDLDEERKLVDSFKFDEDSYQEKLIPFDSIEVLDYREDGSCYLMEITKGD